MLNLILLLLACAPAPTTLVLTPADNVSTWSLAPLPLPEVRVLDEDGRVIERPPAPIWTVTPPGVATLSETTIKPKESGTATVQAAVGSARAHYVLDVNIPDRLMLVASAKDIATGGEGEFIATLSSGGTPTEGPAISWSTSDASILRFPPNCITMCTATARNPGVVLVTVRSGPLSASTTITVGQSTGSAPCDPGCHAWTECVAGCASASSIQMNFTESATPPDPTTLCIQTNCAKFSACTTSCAAAAPHPH